MDINVTYYSYSLPGSHDIEGNRFKGQGHRQLFWWRHTDWRFAAEDCL